MNNEYINNIPHIYYIIGGGVAVAVLYNNTLNAVLRYKMKLKSNLLTNEYLDTYLNLHKVNCFIINPGTINVSFVDGIDEQKYVSFSIPNQDYNASDVNFFVQKRLNILGKPVFEVIQNVRCKEILSLLSYRLAENTHFVKLLKREDLRLSNNKLNSRQKSTLVQVLNSELEEFVTNEVLLLQDFDIYKELNNPLNKDSNLKRAFLTERYNRYTFHYNCKDDFNHEGESLLVEFLLSYKLEDIIGILNNSIKQKNS